MTTVEFQYNGYITYVHALNDELLRTICSKFAQKVQANLDAVNFLYYGRLINFDLTLIQTINKIDNERKRMSIIAFDTNSSMSSQSFVESPFIVCPICKEQALIDLNNYRIKIYGCKNGHTTDNILFSELEKTQLIDESKIICGKCKIKNKSNTYNRQMYICNTCNMNLCPSCKSQHDNNHKIIDYYDKYYICSKHNKKFNFFCKTCKKHACELCEDVQKNCDFDKIYQNDSGVVTLKQNIKLGFNTYKVTVSMIIDRINNVMKNYEILFKLIERNIENYDVDKINYYINKNINSFYSAINFSKVMEDLEDLMRTNMSQDFIPKILKIYNEINKNEIDLIYNIPNDNKDITIFGYEFVKRNKDLCNIIYQDEEYDLTDTFDCKNINSNQLKIKLKGINNVLYLDGMFSGCSQLSHLTDFSNWDTTYVISMSKLFEDCKFEKLPDISNFNTSNVLFMEKMFLGCSSLKSLPDISKFNTSNVIDMKKMFKSCESLISLPDISKWDITNVLKISGVKGIEKMFKYCSQSLIIPKKFITK